MNESLVNNQAVLDAAPQQSATPAPQGKMFTQDEVNYLSSKVRDQAYEKAKQDLQAMQQQQAAQNPGLSKDDIMQVVNEALLSKENNYSAMNIVQKFNEGMETGKQEYPDFEKVVTKRINLQSAPQIVGMVADFPDKHDIMYELGKKPAKLAVMQTLIREEQYESARAYIDELRESISENKEAKVKAEKTKEPAPLNKLKATTSTPVSGSSGTPASQSDMRQALWEIRRKKQGF